MKIEKRGNSYRVRQTYKGKTYTISFDHKPTQKEINILMAEKMQHNTNAKPMTFEYALDEYIESKSNILSPSTIRGYKQLKRMYSDHFRSMNIYDIEQEDIQREVNKYALNHSAKSVKNYHGLISAVMALKRPSLHIHTLLPQSAENEPKPPALEDIRKILDDVKGTEYSIPIQLACLGLRKSEICALELSDLNGNILSINKAMVLDENNKLVIKPPKSVAGYRDIYIPDELADEIRAKGYIFKGYPNTIIRALHRSQDRLGIPRCKLHELRHFYISYAHAQGVSNADLIASIGHKTDAVLRRYRHAMSAEEEQKRIASSIFSQNSGQDSGQDSV